MASIFGEEPGTERQDRRGRAFTDRCYPAPTHRHGGFGAGVRIASLAAATGGLLTLGLLAMLSIGLPLFVAGILTASGLGPAWSADQPASIRALALALALLGPATLIAGIALT